MSLPGNKSLAEHDPEMAEILQKEMARQYRGLEMIASENLTSRAVMECLGSAFSNKYAEGEAGGRYYGGCEYVDEVERLAKARALAAFKADPEVWGVNVQPYSGSPANFAALTALLKPHERMMGLDLPCGGHLTHGFYTAKKKISATSIYFESLPYHTDENGIIDYAEMERVAEVYRPQVIVVGASAYPRDYDFTRVRALCDNIGCYMMCDIAHSAGLVAAGIMNNPFDTCDIVTTTTHKSLRGPRAGMIFFRKKDLKGNPTDFELRVNQAVFPGLQGGPHMHQVAAIATQMKEVCTPEWKSYAELVVANCRALADALIKRGHVLASGGTDNHLLLWNLRPHDLTGSKAEKLMEAVSISINKNTIAGDKNALTPGGVRVGTAALSTRGLQPGDMDTIAEFFDRAVKIGVEIQATTGKPLKDFIAALPHNAGVKALKADVEAFASKFPMPGFDVSTLKYKDGIPE